VPLTLLQKFHTLAGAELIKMGLLSSPESAAPILPSPPAPRSGSFIFCKVARMVQRTGKAARLPFPVHPHMLRHSTGYKLANDAHDTRSLAHYLGHRNLQSTARYTALAPDRFKGFWQD
jgi:integrase